MKTFNSYAKYDMALYFTLITLIDGRLVGDFRGEIWMNESRKMVKNTIHCRHFVKKCVILHPRIRTRQLWHR